MMGFEFGTGTSGWATRSRRRGQCLHYYKVLSGSNEVTVTVTSSIQNVEELQSVSLAKGGSTGCL
jgi:hypothetical protein